MEKTAYLATCQNSTNGNKKKISFGNMAKQHQWQQEKISFGNLAVSELAVTHSTWL